MRKIRCRKTGAKNNEFYFGYAEFEVPATPQFNLFHERSFFPFQRLSILPQLLGLFC